jgi:hypothetical protein
MNTPSFLKGVWARLNGGAPTDNPYQKVLASKKFLLSASMSRIREAQERMSHWASGFACGRTFPRTQ